LPPRPRARLETTASTAPDRKIIDVGALRLTQPVVVRTREEAVEIDLPVARPRIADWRESHRAGANFCECLGLRGVKRLHRQYVHEERSAIEDRDLRRRARQLPGPLLVKFPNARKHCSALGTLVALRHSGDVNIPRRNTARLVHRNDALVDKEACRLVCEFIRDRGRPPLVIRLHLQQAFRAVRFLIVVNHVVVPSAHKHQVIETVALDGALIVIIPCAAGPRPFDVANLPHDRIAVDKRRGAAGKRAAVARKRK
jgi:hypothetical protein